MNFAVLSRHSEPISANIASLCTRDGTAGHEYPQRANVIGNSGASLSISELADAAYFLGLLHGRQPGVIDHAANKTVDNAARRWLIDSMNAFSRERAYLVQLCSLLGPAPSTVGHAECEAAFSQQKYALDILAQSDRRGCAMGAAIALALDWHAIRKVLDLAAVKVRIKPTPCTLPDEESTLSMAKAIAVDSTVCRAIRFGAKQTLQQHRALWDMLAARSAFRQG